MTEKQLDLLLKGVQKPGRYTGGEYNQVVKDKEKVDVRFAFCFPDTYEIGMSHLGIKILYSLLNSVEGVWCERAFAPLPDMEENMKKAGIGVWGLESLDELKCFDVIGFTLQYEMCYTTMLHMLKISNIPLLSSERKGLENLVVAGGPCTCNLEPVADFIDLAFLGDGEDSMIEFINLYKDFKKKGASKQDFLQAAAKINGVYIPSFYDVSYHDDGTVKEVKPNCDAPEKPQKAIVQDLDSMFFPETFVVPYINTVFDRATAEVFRGCIRGCRFCQAGMMTRPVREKSPKVVSDQAKSLCDSTGYDELSLCSLSTSDYTKIEELLCDLLDWTEKDKVNISLPSMRIDAFSPELLEKVSKVRKSGLTFAPEAGSQRMRNVINKNLDEDVILDSCKIAFEGGHTAVKLYFMLGLPTETMEDIEAIGELAQKIVDLFYEMPNKPKGKGVQVSISLATFVPKPHTPFQWFGQNELELVRKKQQHLVEHLTTKKIQVSWHESKTSLLEAVLARGDRKLNKVMLKLAESNCNFDAWDEYLDFEKWEKAFKECGLSMEFYANRQRDFDEVLPWDHLDYGVTKEFLIREMKKAEKAEVTQNCREKCAGCGANKMLERGTDCAKCKVNL